MHVAASNPKVQRLRRLTGRRSARYDENRFVVEGDVLIEEALAANIEIDEIFVREDRQDDFPVLDSIDAPLYVLEKSVFNAACDTVTPQGVIAVCVIPDVPELSFAADTWVIVADEISDPGNLGTIMRSCEVAGASALVLLNRSVDPYSPKVVRASAGALFHLPVVSSSYEELHAHGMRLFGTTSHTDPRHKPQSYTSVNYSGCIGIVLGNEAHGIAPDAPVDEWITIDHVGRSESLNVAMSASILAIHVSQSRGQKG